MATIQSFSLSMAIVASALVTCSCSTSSTLSRSTVESVRWPELYQPERTPFLVQNEIEIAASPEAIWEILAEAESWPTWYEGAIGVKVKDSPNGRLRKDSVFSWNTMGIDFESVVTEFAPPQSPQLEI
ncbi:MAG: SRPBCC family protein [Verrucomicrobiota bacterium]